MNNRQYNSVHSSVWTLFFVAGVLCLSQIGRQQPSFLHDLEQKLHDELVIHPRPSLYCICGPFLLYWKVWKKERQENPGALDNLADGKKTKPCWDLLRRVKDKPQIHTPPPTTRSAGGEEQPVCVIFMALLLTCAGFWCFCPYKYRSRFFWRWRLEIWGIRPTE